MCNNRRPVPFLSPGAFEVSIGLTARIRDECVMIGSRASCVDDARRNKRASRGAAQQNARGKKVAVAARRKKSSNQHQHQSRKRRRLINSPFATALQQKQLRTDARGTRVSAAR